MVYLQHNVDMNRHLTAPAAGTKLILLILLLTAGVITLIMTSMTRGALLTVECAATVSKGKLL